MRGAGRAVLGAGELEIVDEFRERRFPDVRTTAATSEEGPEGSGRTKGLELAKVARADVSTSIVQPGMHKARSMARFARGSRRS